MRRAYQSDLSDEEWEVLAPQDITDYRELVGEINPDLIIFDSWLKFLGSAGLEENSNDDIVKWSTAFLKPARDKGITTVVLDHVPHDAKRSRGASRKRDEVDVQFAAMKTQDFNRSTVGEIKLKLEKERLGWLPESITFSIGGDGRGNFVCSMSKGTVESPGAFVLKTTESKALTVLKEEFGSSGARLCEWQKACQKSKKNKVSPASVKRAKEALLKGQMIYRDGPPNEPKFYPVENGPGSRGPDPENSSYLCVIPDRDQEGSNCGHDPEGMPVGSAGSHPLRGDPVTPHPETEEKCLHGEPGGCADCKANRLSPFGGPTAERAFAAMRNGNGPRMAAENVVAGTQRLADLAKSVVHYYGANRADGWEEWLEPVAEAFDRLTAEEEGAS